VTSNGPGYIVKPAAGRLNKNQFASLHDDLDMKDMIINGITIQMKRFEDVKGSPHVM
jgi:hypothetical protein